MRLPARRLSPPGRRRAAAAGLACLLLALTACGDGGSSAAEGDDGSSAPTSSEPSDASPDPDRTATSGGAGSYPTFAPADYSYRLEVLCHCPQAGPVRVRVRAGEVRSATSLGDGRGMERGAEAPRYARLTINDIIAVANDPQVDHVDVTWPDGQDHPSVVEVDRLAGAVDDEVTYTIRDVRVTE